jgi:hypothetical protein
MATLAVDTQPVNGIKGDKLYSFKVKNSTAVYLGGLVALDSTGYIKPFAAAAGEQPLGRLQPTPDPTGQIAPPLTGNTSSSPVPEGTVSLESEILVNVPVTGVTAITDVGKLVFLSTDNLSADLTLTRPARGIPIGKIVRWYSATRCDVLRFSSSQLDVLGLAGTAEASMVAYLAFGDISTVDLTIATPPYRGKVRSISFTTFKAFTTGAAGSVTIQPKISGTLTTGGVVTVNTTGGTGGTTADVCAGTAITAVNTFSESDTLKLALTLTSTFSAGSGIVNVVYDRLPGV